MRVGSFARLDKYGEYLRFLKQYGISDVAIFGSEHPDYQRKFAPEVADKKGTHWDFQELVLVRKACEDGGMRLISIENPFPNWCYDKVQLGLPGRDQQIENIIITIRNMGRAGIPAYGYHWMVNGPEYFNNPWRTSQTTPGRGGALVTSFDLDIVRQAPLFRGREYTDEEMWDNYTYFIKAVAPEAEKAGVRLALHPDDPPVPILGGMPRLFHDFEGFQRAMDIAGSPASGLNLCLGNWTAMGTDIPAAIRYFGSRGLIVYGHAQGVQGAGPKFQECFLDEADCDFVSIVRSLKAVGFDSALLPSHEPLTLYEDQRGTQGLAYSIGYMRGIIDAVNRS